MNVHVFSPTAHVTKSFAADGARVGPLPGVNPHVLLEVAGN